MISDFIDGYDRATAYLGGEPRFHDAEIKLLALRLGRTYDDEAVVDMELVVYRDSDVYPSARLGLRFWGVRINELVTTLDFAQIYEIEIEDFRTTTLEDPRKYLRVNVITTNFPGGGVSAIRLDCTRISISFVGEHPRGREEDDA